MELSSLRQTEIPQRPPFTEPAPDGRPVMHSIRSYGAALLDRMSVRRKTERVNGGIARGQVNFTVDGPQTC